MITTETINPYNARVFVAGRFVGHLMRYATGRPGWTFLTVVAGVPDGQSRHACQRDALAEVRLAILKAAP